MNIAQLQFNEIERIAYLTGHPLVAMLAESADDSELLVDGFDDRLETAEAEGFEKGYKEGLGEDADKTITAMRHELTIAQEAKKQAVDKLLQITKLIDSDMCKTIKGRHELSKQIFGSYIRLRGMP